MPRGRKSVKGRGHKETEVLAVRIKKQLYNDFMEVIRRNNLDKPAVVEDAIFQWMLQNVDKDTYKLKNKEEIRARLRGDLPPLTSQSNIADTITLEQKPKIQNPITQQQTHNEGSSSYICSLCATKLKNYFQHFYFCEKCGRLYAVKDGSLTQIKIPCPECGSERTRIEPHTKHLFCEACDRTTLKSYEIIEQMLGV